jgi:two-component system, LytTR family, sensor kinase
MYLTRFRKHFSQNKALYYPYLYPILMPLLTMHTIRDNLSSFEDVFRYWAFTGFLQLLHLIFIQKTLYSKSYTKIVRWLIAIIGGLLIIWVYVLLDNHFLQVIEKFRFANNYAHIVRYITGIFLLIAIIEGVKSATERRKLIFNNIMLENENAQAQLNLLLQQINPHFLFNCLTVLQAMARSKDTRTGDFIAKLGDVYHQTLKTDKGTVTLREELDFFHSYMYLMNLRQENAFLVDVQVSDEALSYKLPCFSLQLLAENCVKHNIVSASKPLSIRLYQKDLKSLTIENNYQPKAVKSESFGIGIKNLKKRYALEGIEQGVLIEQTEITYSTTLKLF